MSGDRYQALANSALGSAFVKRLGLPAPPPLERHEPGMPVVSGPVVFGQARGGRLAEPVRDILRSLGARTLDAATAADEGGRPAALVFDATGIDSSPRLRALYDFFHPVITSLGRNGRVVVFTTPAIEAGSVAAATAQRAIEGFVRSVAKEVGRYGSTAQLVEVAAGGEGAMESTIRFLLSARSAYVDGQAIHIQAADGDRVVPPADWERPLAGVSAAVTGAARGIGESIAATLADRGAEVLCIDIPPAGEALLRVANGIGGTSLALDITDAGAPQRLADHIGGRGGRIDAFVHNAGITRDRTIARMPPENWDMVVDVNLSSQERLTEALLEGGLIGARGRIVSVSSVSGIAGNRGQTNYATSKAGVIGMVRAWAPAMRERSATINAVAPGFIETQMTAAMPVGTREAGRRMNSLLQGGKPVDVAETIAWLVSPASGGLNGNVVRVCGQQLLGA
jgi:3-oxoacyl-[acyl-carrier protein] reductase